MVVVDGPAGLADLLGPLPDRVTWLKRPAPPIDMAMVFVTRSADLVKWFPRLAAMLVPTGMIWVAWPKKSANVPTDVVFDVVQHIGLDAGLVDVKICAIDDTWSGLKFVIRLKDRAAR